MCKKLKHKLNNAQVISVQDEKEAFTPENQELLSVFDNALRVDHQNYQALLPPSLDNNTVCLVFSYRSDGHMLSRKRLTRN